MKDWSLWIGRSRESGSKRPGTGLEYFYRSENYKGICGSEIYGSTEGRDELDIGAKISVFEN